MRVQSARGFTLIELLIVVAVIGILSAISAHQLRRARAAANESSAIGTLRAVSSGQIGFAATCGSGHYADAMATLVNGNFVSPDANVSPKSGFNFTLLPGSSSGSQDCQGGDARTSYVVTAVRVAPGYGNRGFAVNQLGTVWQDLSGAAPIEPFTLSANVSPIH